MNANLGEYSLYCKFQNKISFNILIETLQTLSSFPLPILIVQGAISSLNYCFGVHL